MLYIQMPHASPFCPLGKCIKVGECPGSLLLKNMLVELTFYTKKGIFNSGSKA